MSGQKWIIVAAIVLAIVAGLLFPSGPTQGQPGAAAGFPAAPGRFQIQASGGAPTSTVFVLDTGTGQVWYRQAADRAWTDMGSPAARDGKR